MEALLPLTPGYLGCSLWEDKDQLPLGIHPQSVINLGNSYVLFIISMCGAVLIIKID